MLLLLIMILILFCAIACSKIRSRIMIMSRRKIAPGGYLR